MGGSGLVPSAVLITFRFGLGRPLRIYYTVLGWPLRDLPLHSPEFESTRRLHCNISDLTAVSSFKRHLQRGQGSGFAQLFTSVF